MWWLFAIVPRIFRDNILLTRFECQRFDETTKADKMHIVYILMLIRSHLHISYLKESQEFIYFANEKYKIQYIDFTIILAEIWHINSF